MENNNLGAVNEITEMIFVAKEMEKYQYLAALTAITEEIYFYNHSE